MDYLARAEHSPKPFYMFLPFQNIHEPYSADPKFYDMYANRTDLDEELKVMFGYITELDFAVGDIIKQLKESGQYNNTYIFFSSDNGAPPIKDHNPTGEEWLDRNYPFKGYKTQNYEGGSRVPGFVHSPLLPAAVQGTKSHKLYHVTDWLPTMINLAQGSNSRNFPLDGFDMLPSISDPDTPSPRTEIVYNLSPICYSGQAGVPKAALRQGRYKLLTWCYNVKGIDGSTATGPVNCNATTVKKGKCPEGFRANNGGPILFDLQNDVGERHNIAESNPAVVASMLARLKELADEMVQPQIWDRPFQGPDYFCKDCPLRPALEDIAEGWGPWL